MRKKSASIANFFPPYVSVVSLCLMVGAWEAAVRLLRIPTWILPGPLQIARSLWDSRTLFWFHSSRTILETLLGLTAAIVLGTALAILMEYVPAARKILYPVLLFSQTVPFIILAPLLVIWLGYGITAKIVLVTLVCFFPIAINLSDGLRTADRNMIRLLRSMGASTQQTFRYARIPSSAPFFFSGLRIAGTYAVLTAVISEWIGSDRGLGIFLVRAAKSFQTERVLAGAVIISGLSLILVMCIEKVARRVVPWHYQLLHKKGTLV